MSRVKEPFDPCAEKESTFPGCYRPALERLRFWNGRFLVARDLRDQQEDLIRRLEYHQSFAHGEGVLCGFQVQEHPREECRDRWLVVEPGMAYDCCGRTLWMPDRRAIEIPWPEEPAPGEADRPDRPPEAPEPPRPEHGQHPPRPPQGSWAQQTPWEQRQPEQEYPGTQYPEQQRPQQQHPGQKHPEPQPPEGKRPEPVPPAERPPDPQWFILACRVECPTDPVPALYADDLCDPVRHEHGRLREDVTIRVVPAADVSDECWPRYRPVVHTDCSHPFEDDCGLPLGDTPPCRHGCECGECLVLAAVWREPRTRRLRWDTTHRKVLAPAVNLTRINGLNWPHGGFVSIDELMNQQKGQLIVRFSRPLRPTDGFRTGINRMTFTAAFLGPTGAFEQIVPPEPEDLGGGHPTPRLSPNRRCAIFEIPQHMLRGLIKLAGTFIHVRLLCDFLIDCHGRAVSGAHIAGDANGRGSGNGVPGGIFESWFYLKAG